MKRRLRHLMNNNSGSTLVEIIVSVLIVGIAFVPLIGGMNTALKVNNESENEMYAKNVATNCIEVVKAAGSIATIPSGFDTSTGITVSEAPGKITVEKLKEGIYEYKAVITYNPAAGKSGNLNKAENYSSIGEISGSRRAMVNCGADHDYIALDGFLNNQNEGKSVPGETVFDALKDLKEKTITITIEMVEEDITDPLDSTKTKKDIKCRISPTITYVMDNSNGKYAEPTRTEVLPVMEKKNAPETIILFTSPIHDVEYINATSTSISESLMSYINGMGISATIAESNPACKEKIVINNKLDNLTGMGDSKLNVYDIVAGADVKKTYTNTMDFEVYNSSSANNSLNIYSPMKNNYLVGTAADIDKLIKSAVSEEIAKIYDVKVEVTETQSNTIKAEVASTVVLKER